VPRQPEGLAGKKPEPTRKPIRTKEKIAVTNGFLKLFLSVFCFLVMVIIVPPYILYGLKNELLLPGTT